MTAGRWHCSRRRTAPASSTSRVFYATDVHGSERTFRKFINGAKFYKVDHIIMGGDITGKFLVPIVHEHDSHFRVTLQGTTEAVEGETAAAGGQGAHRDARLLPHHRGARTSCTPCRRTRTSRRGLPSAGARAPGALDSAGRRAPRRHRREVVRHGRQRRPPPTSSTCSGRRTASTSSIARNASSWSTTSTRWPTAATAIRPRGTRRGRRKRRRWRSHLERAVEGIEDFTSAIFNMHVPPYDCTLDECPKLDWSTDPPTPIVVAGVAQSRQCGQHGGAQGRRASTSRCSCSRGTSTSRADSSSSAGRP